MTDHRESAPPIWFDEVPLPSPEDYGPVEVPKNDRPSAAKGATGLPEVADISDFYDRLISNRQGLKVRSLHNAGVFLECHPSLRGRLMFDVLQNAPFVASPLPWDRTDEKYPRFLDDSDATAFAAWLERQEQFGFSKSMAMDALQEAARKNRIDPLTSYLETLQWDGAPRIDRFLEKYLGCRPSPYLTVISNKFLIGAAARALRPGAKLDTMLVLEGAQGAGKSTAVRALFGDAFFSDEIADFGSKDAAQQMQGKWCIEVAELSALSRSDVRDIKAFLSRQVDRFRAPYDRLVSQHPRRCILVGSSNDDTYLRDATGGRRFWPVSCGRIDVAAIARDRDQLWAEAVHRFHQCEAWWLSEAEQTLAGTEQDKRHDTDGWVEEILRGLDAAGISETTAFEVCRDHLRIDVGRIGRAEQMRATVALKRLKWTSHQIWKAGQNTRVWRRP